jgi:hypothetical protein
MNTKMISKEGRFPQFLQEPFYSDLTLSDDSIELLNGKKWLSTDLMDFLIKHALPRRSFISFYNKH